MKKLIIVSLSLFFLIALTIPAMADPYSRGQRKQADSYYRMSKKAYNDLKNNYNDVNNAPPQQKESACTKIRRAILYNNNNYVREDLFRQRVVKKQLDELRHFQLDLGCPTTEKKKGKLGVSGSIQIGL